MRHGADEHGAGATDRGAGVGGALRVLVGELHRVGQPRGPAVDERPTGTVEDAGTSDAPVGDTVFPGNDAEPLRVGLVGRRRWRIRRPHDAEG